MSTDYWQFAAILRSREKLREGEKYNVATVCLPTSKAQMFATARDKSSHRKQSSLMGYKKGWIVWWTDLGWHPALFQPSLSAGH